MVLCMGSSVVFSQQENLFVTEFKYVPSTSNTVGFQDSNVAFKYAVKLKNGSLINGLKYTSNRVIYNDSEKLEEEPLGIELFQSIAYSLNLKKEIVNGWSYNVNIAPTVASNFESSLTFDDFFVDGGVVFAKKFNNNTIHFGVVRNLFYGFHSPIPLITVDGAINDNLKYSVGFPITELSYIVNNTNEFSMFVKPKGFYANIANDLVVNVDDDVESVQFQSFVTGLQFSHCVDDNWLIVFDAGYQLKSDYELLDKNKNSVYEFKTKNNFSAGVSLKFNLLNDKS